MNVSVSKYVYFCTVRNVGQGIALLGVTEVFGVGSELFVYNVSQFFFC